SGIETITSGSMRHPSCHSIAAGLSLGSPSCAPVSAQAASVLISAAVNSGALRKPPYRGSASHGGICLLMTAFFMAFAQGRALSYVSIENGATSPGRWQDWQFFCNMGRTSLLKVGAVGSAATSETEVVRIVKAAI